MSTMECYMLFPLFKNTSPDSSKKTSPVNNLLASGSESDSRSTDEFRFENPYQKKLEQITKPYTVVSSGNTDQIPENTILLTFEQNGEGKKRIKPTIGKGTKIDNESLGKLLQSVCKKTSTETEILDTIEKDETFQQLIRKEIKKMFPKADSKKIHIKIREATTFNPTLQKIEEDAVDLVYVKSGNKEVGQWHLLTPTENFPALHEQITPSHSLYELLYAKKLKEEAKLDNELKGNSTRLDVISLSKLLHKLFTPLTEKEILNTIADKTFQQLVKSDIKKLLPETDPTKILIKTMAPNTFDPKLQQIKEKDAAILIYEESGNNEKAGQWHLLTPTKNLLPVHKKITSTQLPSLHELLYTRQRREEEVEKEIKDIAKSLEEQLNKNSQHNPVLSHIQKEDLTIFIGSKPEQITVVTINSNKASPYYKIIPNNSDVSFVQKLITDKAEIFEEIKHSDENFIFFDWLGEGCNKKSESDKDYSNEKLVECAKAVYSSVQSKNPHGITLVCRDEKSATIFSSLHQKLQDKDKEKTHLVSFWPGLEEFKKSSSLIPKEHNTSFILQTIEPNLDPEKIQEKIITFSQQILKHIEDDTTLSELISHNTRTLFVKKITEQYDSIFMNDLVDILKNCVKKAHDWNELPSEMRQDFIKLSLSNKNILVINPCSLIKEAFSKWLQSCEVLLKQEINQHLNDFNNNHPYYKDPNEFAKKYCSQDPFFKNDESLKDISLKKEGEPCKKLKRAILNNPLMFPLINKELRDKFEKEYKDDKSLETKSISILVNTELYAKFNTQFQKATEQLIINVLDRELPRLIEEMGKAVKIDNPNSIDHKHLLNLENTKLSFKDYLVGFTKELHEEYEHSQQPKSTTPGPGFSGRK